MGRSHQPWAVSFKSCPVSFEVAGMHNAYTVKAAYDIIFLKPQKQEGLP